MKLILGVILHLLLYNLNIWYRNIQQTVVRDLYFVPSRDQIVLLAVRAKGEIENSMQVSI